MAYETWPTTLDNPDSPIKVNNTLPIATGKANLIGTLDAQRINTRPVVKAQASLLLAPDQIQILRTFWSTTLFRGKLLFTAPWLEDAGYPFYVARLVRYTLATKQAAGVASMHIDFIPDIRLNLSSEVDTWPSI